MKSICSSRMNAAFGCHGGDDESFIFSGEFCAKINYAPGTTNDKILEGPCLIDKMFPFFKGTKFNFKVDAAFESSKPNEVYIFKGGEYALVDYIQRKLIAIRPIVDGFNCLQNTIFDSDIGAAFASHNSQEAYLFKGNSYVILHFTPGQTKDYIISGPKEIVPNNWPSLVNILPRYNAGVDMLTLPEEFRAGPHPEHDPNFVFRLFKSVSWNSWWLWTRDYDQLLRKIQESCRILLREAQFKKVYGTMLYWMSPTLISSVVLFGCALLRSAPLVAATIFTILATLRTMSEPVRLLPDAISALIQVKVSFDRITSLDNRMTTKHETEKSGNNIRIQDGNFYWDPESTTPTLRNVNLEVKRGQKVAVCGSVGSGKSSMLYAILGEISRTSGTVDVFGSIGYVSQRSWIQSGTLQDNILYGKPMNRIMYEKAIKACALDKDIEAFKHGDLT
ncbi:multidrug resistance-associated protein 6 [Tanacetum coccineum]